MNIINITESNKHLIFDFSSKNERQLLHINEPERGVFIAESPYVIDLALKAGCIPICFVCREKELENPVIKSCDGKTVYTAPDSLLKSITGFDLTGGVLCKMLRPQSKPIEDIFENASRIAVLEHIMNPANVGAIIRSAAALGIEGIILTKGCADPLYRRAVRVSMGSVFKLPYAFFEKDRADIELVKKAGFKTVAMALTDNSVPIDDKCLIGHSKLAVVLGSEGEGLCDKTVADCDFTAKIPMINGIDSLNVAAASAVAFWQLRK